STLDSPYRFGGMIAPVYSRTVAPSAHIWCRGAFSLMNEISKEAGMANSGTPWLTQEAYDRLKNELDHISGPHRQEIVDRIEAARDEGDLKENAGYHAAREQQSKNEGRIQELKALLENAEVGESAADDGIVKPGMLVECKLAGNTMKFVLGSREIAVGS